MNSERTSLPISSFEETFKTAYSHGLEQIYALETVDLSKVKRIENYTPNLPEVSSVAEEPTFSLWNGQYELELGDEYRGWMKPLFLEEPIQVLKLSQRIEKELLELGKRRLSDLVKKEVIEKIRQRDGEEIQSKLAGYLISRSQERTFFIEWASLIRSLMVEMDWKKGMAFLEPFGLESLIFLNPLEKMEFSSTKPERKDLWRQEMKEALRQGERVEQTFSLLMQIAKVFVTPWMRGRGGIASERQIKERIEKVSEEPSIARQAMAMISTLYCEGQFFFRGAFCEVEEGVFCVDALTKETFYDIRERAEGYFYKPGISYPLEELVRFLRRDLAKEWKDCSEEQIGLFLRRSSRFRVRKGVDSRVLEVRSLF